MSVEQECKRNCRVCEDHFSPTNDLVAAGCMVCTLIRSVLWRLEIVFAKAGGPVPTANLGYDQSSPGSRLGSQSPLSGDRPCESPGRFSGAASVFPHRTAGRHLAGHQRGLVVGSLRHRVRTTARGIGYCRARSSDDSNFVAGLG